MIAPRTLLLLRCSVHVCVCARGFCVCHQQGHIEGSASFSSFSSRFLPYPVADSGAVVSQWVSPCAAVVSGEATDDSLEFVRLYTQQMWRRVRVFHVVTKTVYITQQCTSTHLCSSLIVLLLTSLFQCVKAPSCFNTDKKCFTQKKHPVKVHLSLKQSPAVSETDYRHLK